MKPKGKDPFRQPVAGFTVLEMIVVLGIVVLLGSLSLFLLFKQRTVAQNVGFADQLVQDINSARSYAMARGATTWVTFNSPTAYTVTSQIGTGPIQTITSQSNTQIALSGFSNGDYLKCSTRGLCPGFTAGGASKSIPTITLTYQGIQKNLDITVLGLARIRP